MCFPYIETMLRTRREEQATPKSERRWQDSSGKEILVRILGMLPDKQGAIFIHLLGRTLKHGTLSVGSALGNKPAPPPRPGWGEIVSALYASRLSDSQACAAPARVSLRHPKCMSLTLKPGGVLTLKRSGTCDPRTICRSRCPTLSD